MKILYTNFHLGDGGGHTTYVMSLARALGARADVTVAAPRGSRLLDEAAALPGVRTVALQFKGAPARQWRTLRQLRALLRAEAFDVVHVNGSADHRLCMLAAVGLGPLRPFMVYTQHNGRHPRSLGARLRAALATDRVICVSQHTYEGMGRSAFRPQDLRLVLNGVDTAHYRPAAPNEAARAREALLPPALRDRLVVGSHAGTASYKNWLDMVAAVALLPPDQRGQIAVLIAGFSGPAPAAMAELYPPAMRSTGLSIAYNLAVTIFGGFAPFITTWLIVQTGSSLAPAWYVMLAAAISLTTLTASSGLIRGAGER